MPSETFAARCDCGASRLTIQGPPATVAYCHCSDWRRSTGAPVAAFAAFDEAAVLPDLPGHMLQIGGVRRWTCATCAAPLGAAFDDNLPRSGATARTHLPGSVP